MPTLRHGDPFRCTTLLASEPARWSRRRRRLVIGSVVFHVVLLVVLVIASPKHREDEDVRDPITVVFHSPIREVPEPIPPLPELKPAPKPVRIPKLKVPEPKPAITPPVTPAPPAPRVDPPPSPAVALAPPVVAPPKRPRPRPVVREAAGFEVAAAPAARPREAPRVVTSGGFGGAIASASRTKVLPPPTPGIGGAFAAPGALGPVGSKRVLGTVANPGFDTVAGGAGAPRREAPGVVRPSGFATAVGTAPTSPASRELRQPAASRDIPVEIVSKPKPTYTEEARQLRLEGEVVLEVTFVASGMLHVLRILQSLGHGLDEAAVEAVQKIRFTPARRDGRPVDQTTTLRVVFRLA